MHAYMFAKYNIANEVIEGSCHRQTLDIGIHSIHCRLAVQMHLLVVKKIAQLGVCVHRYSQHCLVRITASEKRSALAVNKRIT